MSDRERVLELLRRAVAILEGDKPQEPPRDFQPGEDETILEGTIGRPELKMVGADEIPLYTFGLRVRTPEGQEQWVNAQCWRRTALWAKENLDRGQVVQLIGKWETSTYNGVETNRFSARLIQAA